MLRETHRVLADNATDLTVAHDISYAEAMDQWRNDVIALQHRAGSYWARKIDEVITGYADDDGIWHEPTNALLLGDDSFSFQLSITGPEHLREHLLKQRLDERPRPEDYPPTLDVESIL